MLSKTTVSIIVQEWYNHGTSCVFRVDTSKLQSHSQDEETRVGFGRVSGLWVTLGDQAMHQLRMVSGHIATTIFVMLGLLRTKA